VQVCLATSWHLEPRPPVLQTASTVVMDIYVNHGMARMIQGGKLRSARPAANLNCILLLQFRLAAGLAYDCGVSKFELSYTSAPVLISVCLQLTIRN
jgi:hypothetical protein